MELSVVIPVYNEEENLKILIKEVNSVLKKITEIYEIICIDDGSVDESFKILKELKQNKYPKLRIIKFKNNCGQSDAFAAGFKNANYSIIITLDADLQNDPEDIPKMLKKLEHGYDVVIGWRKNRKDSISKLIGSKIANTIRNILTNDNIIDTGCSLKIYKKEYLDKIKIFKGMHRFLPTLLKMEGAKIATVVVNHRPRKYGESKYSNFSRLIKPFFDCLAVRWMKNRHTKYEIDTIL